MNTESIAMKGIKETNMNLPGQTGFYRGKVRDVYYIKDKYMVMVVSDRISAFDHVLPKAIPGKGQILNQLAAANLTATEDIVPNWMMSTPDPNVMIGKLCDPYKIEMVIRGYLTGHAWRTYKSGKRMLCGVPLPEGMKENDKFPQPIITPSTKADVGHDEDISKEEILAQGLVSAEDYAQLEDYTFDLFHRGTQIAAEKGLILVDTKYEFGKIGNTIYLMDEVHTPDSSRYFYSEGYQERQDSGERQKQLSKEFVREWLMENGFQGKDGQAMPDMPESFISSITERYSELYEKILAEPVDLWNGSDEIENRIKSNVVNALEGLGI